MVFLITLVYYLPKVLYDNKKISNLQNSISIKTKIIYGYALRYKDLTLL